LAVLALGPRQAVVAGASFKQSHGDEFLNNTL
jgi:hypothetical protein